MEPNYTSFLLELKDHILQSRYRAARLVNRELLLLYYAVGKRLSEKISAEKWGAKVVEQLSADLQNQLPGLRGFSRRNLFNMKAFADAYAGFPSVFSEGNESQTKLVQMTSALIDDLPINTFLSLGFSHHLLLIDHCKNIEERIFYMRKAVDSQWTVEMLD